MRMMLQLSIPVEAGNNAVRAGAIGSTLQSIVESMKPECAYFTTTEDGERGGFIIFDLAEPSQIPAIAEPFFLAFNTKVKIAPVMTVEDLGKAAPAIGKAAKSFPKTAGA